MGRRSKNILTICSFALFLGVVSAGTAGEALLFDDFDGNGPLDTKVTWEMASGTARGFSGDGFVLSTPKHNWHSKKKFSEPVSVRFSKVHVDQLPSRGWRNLLGVATDQFKGEVAGWMFDGTVKPRQPILPYIRSGGKDYWHYPDAVSVDPKGTLGDVRKREKAVDLRIDWWPGKLVRYYVNDKQIVGYKNHVPAGPCAAAVLDFNAGFRIDSIKVVRIAKSAEEVLREEARAKAEAARAKAASKARVIRARGEARSRALAAQFPKLRMVIGGPCYMWGIDPQIEAELKAAGMEVLCWPNAPLIDPDPKRLIDRNPTEYNIIIFGDTFLNKSQPDPNTGEIPRHIRDQVPLFRRFLEAGGGIWFSGLGNQDWGRGSHTLNYILKELNLGAEVVGEVVMDMSDETHKYRFQSRTWAYAWADVSPDPLTEGVKNLLHPCGVIAAEGSMGVVPIVKLSPEWRVLVKGKATAASFAPDPDALIGDKLLTTPKTVKSSPTLVAVRQAGKGRVVLWPTWSNFTVTGGSGGKLVDGELRGRRSDGARLIENLLCWLAEPGHGNPNVGTFDPKKYELAAKPVDIEQRLRRWRHPGRQDWPNQYKGLIGAHSSLSDGKNTPEEMIAAAKKAGYDFIAFTEDFARMDEAKWKRLVAACDKANEADASFIAYPGLDFMDEAGNRGLVFGHRYWIRDEWRSKQYPDRIRWNYNLTYKADSNPRRWPPRVIIRSKTNNKRPWNQGLWSFFGAYCYAAGELVDDSFHEWRPLIGRHAFFMNAGIMAVHTVRSPEEIAASARPGLYQTHVRAETLSQVLRLISGCVAFSRNYISAGPEILDFRRYAAVMGGEGSFDLATPGNNRGLLHVLARAEAGLKEVSVHDGERLVRRFLPQGNRFEAFLTFHPDACHSFSLTATDKLGRRAVSWNAYMQIQEKVHRRCGDNWNWMTTGKGPGTARPVNMGYMLLEVTHPWHPRGTEQKAAPRPRYWCEQGSYSHGGLSAAVNRYISPHDLLVDDKRCEACYTAITMDFDTIGRYGIIVTNRVREDYVVRNREKATTGAFSGPYGVAPSPWPADLKQFAPMQRPDGATINRYQGKVTFTRKVAMPDGKPAGSVAGKPVRLRLGATGDPAANVLEVMNPDGTSARHEVGDRTLSGEIPKDGYICWYDEKGDGVGGIIALTPGIQYSYRQKWQECWLNAPSPVSSGTEVAWDVIFVTGSASTRNSNAQMEDVRVGMGVAGKPALYEVEPRVGEVVDQKYFLTLQAEDNGFSGRIVKTGGKPLPIHLPVMIRGLNPRWDAAIWYRGKTRLHTPAYYRDPWGAETWRWVVATYEPRVEEIRYVPVLDGGVGYCQVDTDKQDADVFIGNLLVCDRPEVFITIVKTEKGKCAFEINNPTDKALTCTVRPAKGFEFTGQWNKKLTLPAGSMHVFTVDAP